MVTGKKIMVDDEPSFAETYGLTAFFRAKPNYEYWHNLADFVHNALKENPDTSDLRYEGQCVGDKTIACDSFNQQIIAANCKGDPSSNLAHRLRHIFGMCCLENGGKSQKK